MTIPLPNLDTRRWSDLAEEGRASIVRVAPEWSDHNVHDPGITLLELLSAVVERSIFVANRITLRHRRKFLALAGFLPRPPRGARTLLGAQPVDGAGTIRVPAGVAFVRAPDSAGGLRVPFRTVGPATLQDARLASVHVFDGRVLADRTRHHREGLPILPFGEDPAAPGDDADTAPCLYLGFDRPLAMGRALSVFARLDGHGEDEAHGILEEEEARRLECRRPDPRTCRPCPLPDDPWCPPDAGRTGGLRDAPDPAESPPPLPPHHSAVLVWEIRTASGWAPLSPGGDVVDRTRSLSLSGFVDIQAPAPMAPMRLGDDPADRYYVRARLVEGRHDAAPRLLSLVHNALAVEQRIPVWQELPLAPSYTGGGVLPVGETVPLSLTLDDLGRLTHVAPGGEGDPEAMVLGYAPASGSEPERLRVSLVRVGRGSGAAGQELTLVPSEILGRVLDTAGCPPLCPTVRVADGELRLWSLDPGSEPRSWTLRDDFDASGPGDAHAVLDQASLSLAFGDARRGAPLPATATLVGALELTLAERGNLPASAAWTVGGDPVTRALLTPAEWSALSDPGTEVHSPSPSTGGADAEEPGAAASRAAAVLWAHERLVELAASQGVQTLDGLDPGLVRERRAPLRASGTLDFERLALAVPGTTVRRARAWAGLDPELGCATAPGTVTVVVVPALPRGRPAPTTGMVRSVASFLHRRRILGTRVVVSGPEYVDVAVHAHIRCVDTADPNVVLRRMRARLDVFFDPLVGGFRGRGWPFGRDVYVGDVLRVLDAVEGVDHVLDLRLSAPGSESPCDHLCVPTIGLVAAGDHVLEVEAP